MTSNNMNTAIEADEIVQAASEALTEAQRDRQAIIVKLNEGAAELNGLQKKIDQAEQDVEAARERLAEGLAAVELGEQPIQPVESLRLDVEQAAQVALMTAERERVAVLLRVVDQLGRRERDAAERERQLKQNRRASIGEAANRCAVARAAQVRELWNDLQAACVDTRVMQNVAQVCGAAGTISIADVGFYMQLLQTDDNASTQVFAKTHSLRQQLGLQ